MEDVDRLLEAHGWRPPARHARAAVAAQSVVAHEAAVDARRREADHGLAVFLLRQLALERGGVEKAKALIERHGFSVVRSALPDA